MKERQVVLQTEDLKTEDLKTEDLKTEDRQKGIIRPL